MKTLWGSDREPMLNAHLAQWASVEIFGRVDGFEKCTTMGVFDGPKLIAVMVFYNFERDYGVIEISGAGTDKRWLSRAILNEMFSYPFDQLGCQLIIMRVSAKDDDLRRILTSIGFTGYTIPRIRGRTEDETVYTLTDENWRKSKFHRKVIGHGQEVRARAA